ILLSRSHDDDVRRTDAVRGSDANLVEIGAQLSEENLALPELELIAFQPVGGPPISECDAALRHVLKSDVRCRRFDLAWLNSPAWVHGHIPQPSDLPSFWNLPQLRALEGTWEE